MGVEGAAKGQPAARVPPEGAARKCSVFIGPEELGTNLGRTRE